MKPKVILTLVLFGLFASTLNARGIDDQHSADKVNALINDAESKGLSGYVLVVSEGEALLSRGVGYRSREKNTANTADTVFDIGSNTKQFTATAIMQLVEAGQLEVDQPLSDFFARISRAKSGLTIHQLLTHTSGFEASSGRDFDMLSKQEFLEQVLHTPLEFEPGSRYQYSNVGYSVLAAVIELVSNSDYETYLQNALFSKAGMSQTGYLKPKWREDQIATGYYRGYRNIGNIIDRYQADGVSWNLVGNGGIQSTANDLNKWFVALQSGKILSKASIDLMLSAHAKYPDIDWYYGYGWSNGVTEGGIKVAAHNGSNGVYWSSIFWVPERDLFVSFSTNSEMESTAQIGQEIRRILMNPEYQTEAIAYDIYWELVSYIGSHKVVDIAALKSFLSSRNLVPEEPSAFNRIGLWAMDNDLGDWGVSLLEENIAMFPLDGNLYDSLGEAYLISGNKEKARVNFGRALELGSGSDCGWCANSRAKLEQLEN